MNATTIRCYCYVATVGAKDHEINFVKGMKYTRFALVLSSKRCFSVQEMHWPNNSRPTKDSYMLEMCSLVHTLLC